MKILKLLCLEFFQISMKITIDDGRATYRLGAETFIAHHPSALDACCLVFMHALNGTEYKFSCIPSALNTFKVEISSNGQYYWLTGDRLYLNTCCDLLKELAVQNNVSSQAMLFS